MKTSPRSKTPPTFFSPQVLEARRFYLDLAPPASKPLAVVCGGCECCAPDYAIHRSTFPYYSIELVVRGRGALRLGGQESSLCPGAVFSYGPGVAQDITTETADPLVKYFVDFTGRAPRGCCGSTHWRRGAWCASSPPARSKGFSTT